MCYLLLVKGDKYPIELVDKKKEEKEMLVSLKNAMKKKNT